MVVECPGFATLKFDTSSTIQCSSEFASGTVVHASTDGSYDVYHADGGYLQVDPDGSAAYFPRPSNDLEVHHPGHQIQYNMRHFADLVFDTVDNEGNVFNVLKTGETIVETTAGADVIAEEQEAGAGAEEGVEQVEEETGELGKGVTVETTKRVAYFKQHAPRLFVCHEDGSGTELLRYQDVAEYLAYAEDDPATAILMDSLPEYPGVMGITVLKPHTKSVSDQWIKPYIQNTIVPPGLVSRDVLNLPAREEKKPGPPFGTTAGNGLAIGSAMKPTAPPQPLRCPSKLKIRQILQYKPITDDLRSK